MKLKKFQTLAFLLMSGVFLAGCSFTLAEDITPPPGYQPPPVDTQPPSATSGPLYPLIPPDPAQGEAIYRENCEPCHGATGLGDGVQAEQLSNPIPPIGDAETSRKASPAKWYAIVTQGNIERFMPPFQSLTDRQRWDVVAFAVSLSTSSEMISRGGEVFQEYCALCHGHTGIGDGSQAASLETRPADFTNQQFMAGLSAMDLFQVISEGASPEMPAFREQISEQDRWALTDYLRSLTFVENKVQAIAPAGTPEAGETDELSPTESITTTIPLSETTLATETVPLGTIAGFVQNNSGGEVPEGLEVTLHAFDHVSVVYTNTTKLKPDGSYVFSDVEFPDGRIFLTTIEFDGVTYGSEPQAVAEETSGLELPIQVFESTTDASSLIADRLHLFFEQLDAETLRVVELYVISNPGERTLVASSEGGPILEFSLPSEAINLEFQDGVLGGRYLKTEDGFADTMPIRPGMGEYSVLFAYELPFNRKIDLARPIRMTTNAVVILVPEDGIRIKGDAIQDAGTREVQGVMYHMYNGNGMGAGDQLELSISVSRTLISTGSNNNLLFGLAALGVALIAAGVWMYNRSRKESLENEDETEADSEATSHDPETLMDAILALDDLYREGKLPDEAYHQRRDELKARLKATLDK